MDISRNSKDSRVALITGASSGFGKLTALKLLKNGWIVYATARRVEKMQDLQEHGAHVLKMDVTSSEDVNAVIEEIIAKQGKIDSLLANAGYGSYGLIESTPLDEIEYQYNVNIFGVARVVQATLPHMRQARSGRIVLTSSLVSNISLLGAGWYCSTKHTLKAIGTALRQEVKEFGIDVVMIEPGAVKTEFDDVALNALSKTNCPKDYENHVKGFEKYMIKAYKNCPGPEKTAKAMYEAMTSKNPKTIYRTTLDAKIFPIAKSIFPDKFFDSIIISLIKN